MQAENARMPEHRDDVVIESTRAYATRTSLLAGAIVAAALVLAAVADGGAARPDQAIGAVGGSPAAQAPAAKVERSGSLAVLPLVY
jgi:hypothetical protein